jgi:ABC-type glycerol-3-phosphate transport system substrate-binding protein
MNRKSVTRREFLRLAGLAGATAAVAACGGPAAAPASTAAPAATAPPAATEAPQPAAEQLTTAPQPTVAPVAEKASVRYAMWDWYAYAPGVAWNEWNQSEAFPKFKEEQPNIEVTWEPLGDGWASKILTQMAAGEAPDIIAVWSPSLETWSEKDQLLDLQPLVDADIPNADQIYIKDAWAQMWNPFKQMRMAMLADLDITSIYVDKKAFADAGLETPTLEWDTARYTDAAQKLTKKDASGNITRWGTELRPAYYDGYFHYVEAYGGQVRDEETRMTCMLDSPEAQAGLEWMRSGMWDLNCFMQPNQSAASGLPNTWTGLLPAGLLAMAERSADQFFALADSMPEGGWDVCHIPKGPVTRSCMGLPDEWAMYKGVIDRGNKDAAWSFMKFLVGDWYQSKIVGVAGRIPGLLSEGAKWADALRNLDPRLKSVRLETLIEQVNLGYPVRSPTFRYQQVADELITPAMQSIFTEGKEPVSIFKEIAPKVTAAEKEALAREQG